MIVQPHSGNGIGIKKNNNEYPRKSITETITNGFFIVNREWTVKYWNKAAEKIFGIPAKDILGKNIWKEFAGIIPLDFYEFYYKVFLQDVPVHFEEYWGEIGAWVDVITYHSNGILSVSFKSSRRLPDTEQIDKSEPPLRILNQLYRFVTEVTNDCLWEWNIGENNIFWIDGGHKRVFGYPIENALLPQSFWESRIHPDDKVRILTSINKKFIEESSVWEDEYRFRKADDEYAYVHDRGHIIYDEGKASRMIGATQDITARKLVEMQLLESERKLSLIPRQAVNAMIITDADEKITWVNNAFTQITEYEPDEVIGRKPGSFLQGKETDPSTVKYLREKIKNKQPFDCQLLNYGKSGRKYWIHIQGQPLLNEKGECDRYFAVETDITEKLSIENKQIQEREVRQTEITEAVLTALENERVDIGKELHDNLSQVLAMAKLYAQMARTHDERKDVYLEKSVSFIDNVIEEIRRISKTLIIPGMHGIGLFESIKNVVNDLIRVQSIKIQVYTNAIKEEEFNEKLQLGIFRIVQEQLNNIIKHSQATEATIDLRRLNSQVVLLISDNGQGCRILESENGVGIINIKSRAELLGGSVTIRSKPGEGYELKVVLPVTNSM
jgi:PAS domain S-box-containing protein